MLETFGPIGVILVTVLTGVLMIVRSINEGKAIEAYRMSATPELEPIEKVIERFKSNKRKMRQDSRDNWDEMFMKSLPVKDHPDYFEVDPRTDTVSRQLIQTYSGETAVVFESRYNKYGSSYILDIRPPDGVAYVKHKDLKWEIPLEQLSL